MKINTLKSIIVFAAFSFFQDEIHAQVVNWKNISEQNTHLLHANIGAEYGMTLGLGYHHLVSIKKLPLWIGGECSVPSGSPLADDFKVRLGAQIRIVEINNFQFSARVQGISRRYKSQSAKLFNFGSDLAGTFGYYRKHWFLAVETGFDKAIATRFKHSDWYKKNIYSDVQDGWYQPATGGIFYYGLQGGVSFRSLDFTLRAGRTLQEDFKTKPLIPFYGLLGCNIKF